MIATPTCVIYNLILWTSMNWFLSNPICVIKYIEFGNKLRSFYSSCDCFFLFSFFFATDCLYGIFDVVFVYGAGSYGTRTDMARGLFNTIYHDAWLWKSTRSHFIGTGRNNVSNITINKWITNELHLLMNYILYQWKPSIPAYLSLRHMLLLIYPHFSFNTFLYFQFEIDILSHRFLSWSDFLIHYNISATASVAHLLKRKKNNLYAFLH